MEKNPAQTANEISTPHESPEPGAAFERTPARPHEKGRGEHCLNLYVSYELKERLLALAEKFELSQSDLVRQLLKAGLPVFESLSASQEELLFGFVRALRKSRSMGELKK